MNHEQYRIARFFNEKEKSLNQVTLSLDCGKSLAKRLSQQIREMQKTVVVFWKPRNSRTPELGGMSGHTFSCVLNRNHVSEAS